MRESDILVQFFSDRLGELYDVQAFRNAIQENVPSTEIERIVRSTEDLILSSMKNNKKRAVLRTSQSEYVGLAGASSTSFTWSLEISAPVDDVSVDEDLQRIVSDFTEKIIPVEYKGEKLKLALSFYMPSKFITSTINGTTYIQVVFGGSATLTDVSYLANEFVFKINGERITGLVSFSGAYNPKGETYSDSFDGMAEATSVQTFNNALSMQLHAISGDGLTERLISASLVGDPVPYDIEIVRGDNVLAHYPSAKLEQCILQGSMGSYIVLDVRFLKE